MRRRLRHHALVWQRVKGRSVPVVSIAPRSSRRFWNLQNEGKSSAVRLVQTAKQPNNDDRERSLDRPGQATASQSQSPSTSCQMRRGLQSIVPAHETPTTLIAMRTTSERISGATTPRRRRGTMARTRSARMAQAGTSFQFVSNVAELCCKFEQCQPRVDLRGLVGELHALFGVLSAFFRRRHDSDPTCGTPVPAGSFRCPICKPRAPSCPTRPWMTPSIGRNAPRRHAASRRN